MRKTEPIKPFVTKSSEPSPVKLETTKKLSPPWNPPSLITKASYNKLKSIWPKPNTTTTKPLKPSKPELPKEKPNTPPGLMKTINLQLKSPLWKKESKLSNT